MNMSMFLVFLEKFVNAFNDGKLPSITSAYAALIENEIYEYAESAKDLFRNGLAATFGKAGPMETSDLYFQINRLRDSAFEMLNNCSMVGERNEEVFEKYKLELIEFMDREEARLFEKNEELSRNANHNILYNQMNSFLETVEEVYEDEAKETETIVSDITGNLNADFLQAYLDKKVGISEDVPLAEQIKVFSFQVLMGFKQHVRKLETRKKHMKFREDEKEKNLFERKKMELELAEKNYKRNQQELDDLQEQIQRVSEGGSNEQDIMKYKEEIMGIKRKIKDKEADYENNKKILNQLGQEIKVKLEKKKKKKKGCF